MSFMYPYHHPNIIHISRWIPFLFKQILAYKYFLLAASTPSPTTFVSRVTSSPVLTTEFTNISSQQNDTIIRPKPELNDRKILHFVYLVALLNVRMELCNEEDFSCLYVTVVSRQIEQNCFPHKQCDIGCIYLCMVFVEGYRSNGMMRCTSFIYNDDACYQHQFNSLPLRYGEH